MVPFTHRDCELDFGSWSIGSDVAIDIESDGHDFTVTHVWLGGERQQGTVVKLVEEWVSADLARSKVKGGRSLVRQAYDDELTARRENRSEDRGCHEYHQMRGAA